MNWKQCMLCQSHDDKKELVQNPTKLAGQSMFSMDSEIPAQVVAE